MRQRFYREVQVKAAKAILDKMGAAVGSPWWRANVKTASNGVRFWSQLKR